MLYNNLSSYLRSNYGQRLKKICIDGGFSCPNRDGTCGSGGCIFCGERGAGEHIEPLDGIRSQVEAVLKNADTDDRFIAYFQNYTNTYAPPSVLLERYSEALTDPRIVCLAIGTRPDCIDRDVCKVIASFKDRAEVWVELGLQSVSDEVGELINRGYRSETFKEAVSMLKEYGIKAVGHMIIGLPSEGCSNAVRTAEYIASCGAWGIKIHSIYVMEGTRLAELYREKLYTPPTLDEYVNAVAEVIGHLPNELTVHRITGDCPRDMLVAPEWNSDKTHIINEINRVLKERGIAQGSLI